MKTAYQHTKKGQSCFLRAGLLMLLVLFCSVSGWAAKQGAGYHRPCQHTDGKDGQYGFGRYKPEVAKREWRL